MREAYLYQYTKTSVKFFDDKDCRQSTCFSKNQHVIKNKYIDKFI